MLRIDVSMAFSTFFIVLFIAPVTPELQWEPKLIQDISATAHSFAARGGGVFPLESSLELSDRDSFDRV